MFFLILMKEGVVIGVECTAHTFGVGVVLNGKILVNVRDMYKTEEGGIVPMEAARHHKKVSERIWKEALKSARLSESDIGAIAISNAPGLAPCLYEGMNFAKDKAEKLGVPLIGVNHCIAHLEIGRSAGANDPVLLYTSGANTQIIAYAGGKYRVFGETLDIGVGNFLDKVARYFGKGFPGGPKLEFEAEKSSEKNYIELPYSIKGMDVSFSGLQTKLMQLYDKSEDKENAIQDLSFSLQETAFAMLVEAGERALAHTGKNELVLGGGVACNKRLQEMCRKMCEERGAEFFVPSNDLLVDNGAMIAYTGEIMLDKGGDEVVKSISEIEVKPRERTDDVEVVWR